MIANLKIEIEAAQRQALQLEQEREICDTEIRLLGRHLARQCGTLSDMDTFSASLRRRRRIEDELRLTTRQVVAMRRALAVQRGYQPRAN